MPRVHPRQRCKQCGAHRDDVGDLTTRGYCVPCGRWRVEENILQMQAGRGPFAERHRQRLVAALGGMIPPRLPDDG